MDCNEKGFQVTTDLFSENEVHNRVKISYIDYTRYARIELKEKDYEVGLHSLWL